MKLNSLIKLKSLCSTVSLPVSILNNIYITYQTNPVEFNLPLSTNPMSTTTVILSSSGCDKKSSKLSNKRCCCHDNVLFNSGLRNAHIIDIFKPVTVSPTCYIQDILHTNMTKSITTPLRKNVVSAFQISCKLLSFTLENSCRN